MADAADEQLIAEAQAALARYIRRRTKQGVTLGIARPLYHEGLPKPRCVLDIDGVDVRLYHRKGKKRFGRA